VTPYKKEELICHFAVLAKVLPKAATLPLSLNTGASELAIA
jgi:hypothetical protein